MNTAMRRNVHLLGDRGSRPVSASGASENVDGLRRLPVFGPFSTACHIGSWTAGASIWPQTRTVRCRGWVCGLCVDMDCSRTCSGCGNVMHRACSSPQRCPVGGRRQSLSRGRSPDAPQRIGGHKNLVDTRGHACPVLSRSIQAGGGIRSRTSNISASHAADEGRTRRIGSSGKFLPGAIKAEEPDDRVAVATQTKSPAEKGIDALADQDGFKNP